MSCLLTSEGSRREQVGDGGGFCKSICRIQLGFFVVAPKSFLSLTTLFFFLSENNNAREVVGWEGRKKRYCLFLVLGLVSLPVVADNGELAEEIALCVY